TYGHRLQKTEDPVRSPELKLQTGGLVLRWVTTWESPLLYVLFFFFAPLSDFHKASLTDYNPNVLIDVWKNDGVSFLIVLSAFTGVRPHCPLTQDIERGKRATCRGKVHELVPL
ncbi:hypothetical protein K470DRAFT_241710, partial [Piedraia hortae CBS 480.64]